MPHLYYDPWTNAAACFGILMACLIALCLAAALIVGLVIAWKVYVPFFHIGRPVGRGELKFFDRRKILTVKDGELRHIGGPGSCIQDLRLWWWVGMSSPRKAKWFIGFIRWDAASETSERWQ